MEAETLAAIAASASAGLSLINVVALAQMEKRSENRKWIRDEAVPLVVQTLTISTELRQQFKSTLALLRSYDLKPPDYACMDADAKLTASNEYGTRLSDVQNGTTAALSGIAEQVLKMQEFAIKLEFLADSYLSKCIEGMLELHWSFSKLVSLQFELLSRGDSTKSTEQTEAVLTEKIEAYEGKITAAAHRQYGTRPILGRLASAVRTLPVRARMRLDERSLEKDLKLRS